MKEKQLIEQYFQDHKDAFIEHIRRLVQIRSTKGEARPQMPFGEGPARALDETLVIAQQLGLLTNNIDYYVGTISINEQETKLGILGHVDVVGEGSNWSFDPYEAIVKDGKMYGRGTSDDKGPVIAAMYALAAIKDLGIPLAYNTKLIVGTDEESGCEDIEYYFKKEQAPPYVFTPDAEFPVINIEKGAIRTAFRAQVQPTKQLPRVRSINGGYKVNVVPPEADAVIEGLTVDELAHYVQGVTAATSVQFECSEQGEGAVAIHAIGEGGHASTPESANNAITALLTLIAALPLSESEGHHMLKGVNSIFPHGDHGAEAAGLAMSDAESGSLTMNFSIIAYDGQSFEGYFDSRVPLCATEENTFDVLEQKFAPYKLVLERDNFEPPHHTPADSPFVKTLLHVYEQYTGLPGECIAIGGGTYVHDIEGGVAFGPTMSGIDTRMHSNDEFIIVDDLLLAAQIYAQVIVEICGEQSKF
ncbi:MAG TPA: dipeptidase PepV [Candidatus Paenibacillus intestinavium]|nr:dipeptidase PepV [Candidatus Paenibacillus intestinavium]